jgi:hypothetical protein
MASTQEWDLVIRVASGYNLIEVTTDAAIQGANAELARKLLSGMGCVLVKGSDKEKDGAGPEAIWKVPFTRDVFLVAEVVASVATQKGMKVQRYLMDPDKTPEGGRMASSFACSISTPFRVQALEFGGVSAKSLTIENLPERGRVCCLRLSNGRVYTRPEDVNGWVYEDYLTSLEKKGLGEQWSLVPES